MPYYSANSRYLNSDALNLTFIGPCIANIFPLYSQQDTFLNLFISVRDRWRTLVSVVMSLRVP